MKAKIFLLILAIVFMGSLVNLLLLRFESGDLYPPYSSLRADPLGTKIFFESLDNLNEFSITRNYGPASRLGGKSPETIIFMGLQEGAFRNVPTNEVKVLESIASLGGRLVFLLYPKKPYELEDKPFTEPMEKPEKEEAEEKAQVPEKKDENLGDERNLKKRWGFETDRSYLDKDGKKKSLNANLVAKDRMLPEEIKFHSALYFKNLSKDWKTIYSRENVPVILERSFGKGSIILAGDSYFISNEALVTNRHSQLLSWLIGSNRSIIIDETHHGIKNSQGVVSLARKYGFESLFLSILLVTLLFIWRNSMSLIPTTDDDFREMQMLNKEGRDHMTGFVGLLKRKVPSKGLLYLCIKEWEKSSNLQIRRSTEEKKEIKTIMEKIKKKDNSNEEQISLYNKISKLLYKRREHER